VGALLVLAGVAGLGAVAGPVGGAQQPAPGGSVVADLTAAASTSSGEQQARRDASTQVSRDQVRREAVQAADDAATADVTAPLAVPGSTPAFVQEDTAVVADAVQGAQVLADLERGAQVALSGRTEGGFAELVQDGALAWVDADLVASTKPPPEVIKPPEPTPSQGTTPSEGTTPSQGTTPSEGTKPAQERKPSQGGETTADPVPAGVSGAACPGGSGVESGLTSSTVAVHRAVCAAFPGLVYGGLRPGDPGEHGSGQALDIMVTGAKGDEIAAYLQQHAGELGVDNLIWKQRIWFVGKPHGAWKGMADRGSVTANHYDHVHVGTR